MQVKNVQILTVQDDSRVFIDMPDDDSNPCSSCGVCCSHFRISFYCGEAQSLGGFVPDELTSMVTPVMACMKGTEAGRGRCVALRGNIGEPGIQCAIYKDRPTPCRQYPVWNDDGSPNADCQRLRAAAGLPPLQRARARAD